MPSLDYKSLHKDLPYIFVHEFNPLTWLNIFELQPVAIGSGFPAHILIQVLTILLIELSNTKSFSNSTPH